MEIEIPLENHYMDGQIMSENYCIEDDYMEIKQSTGKSLRG